MGPAPGAAESEVPLQQVSCNDGNGHLETGGEPEPHWYYKKYSVALAVVTVLILIIAVIVLAVLSGRSSAALGPWCPACPDSWVGYRGKCYYCSEAKGNWTYSQRHCSSLGASLAGIDTQQDLDFMLHCTGKFDHWIGLRRDLEQPWKWANGTEFNNLFRIGGGGDCAYLNDLGGVSSSQCTSERHWICTKMMHLQRQRRLLQKGTRKKNIVELVPEKLD
ncbi:C-type lectin domain family 2 member D-like [Chrysemys picta bellii]|uniref:C-type lectin domain family 2 member D-like n=1 Tax=Chrysemys picta bellii TaxID=8478 RepID=UPI0032B2C6CB